MFEFVKNIWRRIMAEKMYEKALEEAVAAYRASGKRQYVVKGRLKDGKKTLRVLDRKNFRFLRRKGCIDGRFRMMDMERLCFWHTAHGNGEGEMDEMEMEWRRKKAVAWLMKKERRQR